MEIRQDMLHQFNLINFFGIKMSIIYNIKQITINHKSIRNIRTLPIDFDNPDASTWKSDELLTTKALKNLKFQKSDIPSDILLHNMIVNDTYYFRDNQELFYGFDLEFSGNNVIINQQSDLSSRGIPTLFITEHFTNIDTNERFILTTYQTTEFTFNTLTTIDNIIISNSIDFTKLVDINFENVNTKQELIQEPLTYEQIERLFPNTDINTPVYNDSNEIITYAYEDKLSNVLINKSNIINISYGEFSNNRLLPCYYEGEYGKLSFVDDHLKWNYVKKTQYTLEDMIMNNTYYCNMTTDIALYQGNSPLYRESYHGVIIHYVNATTYNQESAETQVKEQYRQTPMTVGQTNSTILKMPDDIIFITNNLMFYDENVTIDYVIGTNKMMFQFNLYLQNPNINYDDFVIAKYTPMPCDYIYEFKLTNQTINSSEDTPTEISPSTYTNITADSLLTSYVMTPEFLNEYFNTNNINLMTDIYSAQQETHKTIGTLGEGKISNIMIDYYNSNTIDLKIGKFYSNNGIKYIKVFNQTYNFYNQALSYDETNNRLTLTAI